MLITNEDISELAYASGATCDDFTLQRVVDFFYFFIKSTFYAYDVIKVDETLSS